MESIYQSIEILSKEKGIDSQIVLDAVKDAMLIAARKHFRTNENYVADFDQKRGSLKLFAVKKVVEAVTDPVQGNDCSRTPANSIRRRKSVPMSAFRTPTDALGRISAQTAKQVIFQKVREAERETIYREYADRVGELVNTTIKRIEGLDLVVDLGKTEARLPKREQSRLENFSVGDRVRCVIKIVDKSAKGPGVVVSRADAELVKRLFEQEVPEIYDGTVVIKGCAREAGERTKIAVCSRDRDVDCVGACVGMKGMRVQSIIRELRGEKIDIIEFSEDPVQFATHALSPAKISRVTIIDPGREAHGSDRRRFAALARHRQEGAERPPGGQTARAGKSTSRARKRSARKWSRRWRRWWCRATPVTVLIEYGMTSECAAKLAAAGIVSIEQLGSMTPEQFEEIPGLGDELEVILAAVNNYYGQFEQPAAEEAAEPEPEAVATGGPDPVIPHAESVHGGEEVSAASESAANDSDTISSSASGRPGKRERANPRSPEE